MRNNQPTTQNEYRLLAEQTLVSVTDLKGRITYCNPAFIETSGYTREELLGQPHNLVRHPDMPQEAFRDMWQTIQAQLPWSGLVKNRRKNGDYYWVQANATPMMDGDRLTGYLSVRTAPDAQAVQGAERLYSEMREQDRRGHCKWTLHRGAVMRQDFIGRILRTVLPSTFGQLVMMQVLAWAMLFLGVESGLNHYLLAILAGIAAALLLRRTWSLTIKPMYGLVVDANRLASGDLAHRVTLDGKGLTGQLQQALMQMSVNLRTVVSDVRTEVENLTNSVREIADGNQDLSSRTESQASSLEQTAASMEEINGTVQQSAESVERGAILARRTAEITTHSNDTVLTLETTMQGIAAASGRIGEIIQLIDGVAFQTNILALNAAVEAARAGEQGRGFAVVAAEVRSLAQRTASAAKDITRLIADSATQVKAGDQQTAQAKASMGEALTSVDNVRALLEEVSAGAKEQKTGVAQVNEAVAHMDSITQQNAAMVEQLAAAAKSVQSQVEGVSNSMRLFRLTHGELTLSQVDAVEMRKEHKQLVWKAA
jgi:aerotaxis receptor